MRKKLSCLPLRLQEEFYNKLKHKTLLLSLIFYCIVSCASAQISGRLTDAMSKPVSYATATLLKSADNSPVRSALTTDSGTFVITGVPAGSYLLKITSIGYQNWLSMPFKDRKDFGIIVMRENNRQLGEVVIKAGRPLFQQRPDGTVVNVGNSILSKGSTALEVLERSPGVIIDHRNNGIALNGKSGVTMMINGKLMRIPEDQLVTLLNGMSADNITRIELLNTPGAGYDAEGSAGIINIILKKNRLTGTNGSFSLTGGTGYGDKEAAALSLNHNDGNTNIYGSYNYGHDKSYDDFHAIGSEQEPLLGGFAASDFLSVSRPVQHNHNATLGFDSKAGKTSFGANINYVNSRTSITTTNHAQYHIQPDSVYRLNATINGVNQWRSTSANVYFERQLKAGERLNFDLDYINYKNDYPTAVQSSFLGAQGHQAGTNDTLFSPRQMGLSNTLIQVAAAKADYSKQLSSKLNWQNGVKVTYTRTNSISSIESLVNDVFVTSPSAINNMVMREGITAAYTNIDAKLDSITTLNAGLRFEYSGTRMTDPLNGRVLADRNLNELFPNLLLTRKLGYNNSVFLSYSQRISRPSYVDLASYVTYNGPNSINTGNPLLKPTITYNLRTGYTHNDYSFSVLFSRDDDPIARYQFVYSPDRMQSAISPQNLRYQNYLTFQAGIPFNLGNWVQMNYSLVGGWRKFAEDYTPVPAQHSYFTYSINGVQTYKITAGLSIELSGYYNSLAYNGTRRQDGSGVINAGIKQVLRNNGGSIQLSVADVFKTGAASSYFGKLTEEAFDLKSHVVYHPESSKYQLIKLSYSRSFGGTASSSKKRPVAAEEKERIGNN